jgi:hypothetical protein
MQTEMIGEDWRIMDAAKAAALHCLAASAPGLSKEMQNVIATNIARRTLHNWKVWNPQND